MVRLNLVLKPSQWQAGLVSLLHLLALLSVLLASLIMSVNLTLCMLLFVSYWYQIKYKLNQAVAIRYSKESQWQIAFAAEPYQVITLLGSTTLSSWLVLLQYRLNTKVGYLAIFKDAVTDTEFRRLKVCLKLNGIET